MRKLSDSSGIAVLVVGLVVSAQRARRAMAELRQAREDGAAQRRRHEAELRQLAKRSAGIVPQRRACSGGGRQNVSGAGSCGPRSPASLLSHVAPADMTTFGCSCL